MSIRWNSIMDPQAVHNRTLRLWCMNVNSPEGYVRLKFDGMPGQGREANVPWLWASFPPPAVKGGKIFGAWGRYIPFEGDLFKVSFDYNDMMHIVGYDTKFSAPNTSAPGSGWGQITAAAVGDDPLLLSQFRVLKSGEYDFMSIGGAYIFGSDKGLLHMEGGPAQLNLIKTTNSIDSIAQAYMHTAQAATILYGQVRRFNAAPSPFGVGYIAMAPWNPDGSAIEHQIFLQKLMVGVSVPVKVVRHAMGDVTTNPPLPLGGGIPEISTTTGSLKRFAFDVFDAAGVLSVYSDEVDMLGSQSVLAPTATQFNITYPTGTIALTSQMSKYVTTTSTLMQTGTTFDAIVGTNYSLSTTSGNITMKSSIMLSAESALGMTLKAGATMALSGASLTLTAGGMTIAMPGGGLINLGGSTSASMNYTPFNTGVAIDTATFVGEMATVVSGLSGVLIMSGAEIGRAHV